LISAINSGKAGTGPGRFRADFDNTLAQEVINKGIDLEFETEVIDIEFNGTDSVTTVKNKNGETKEIHAKFVIDSSGYGRVLPRLLDLKNLQNFLLILRFFLM
jgi:flavin-dependent dehydrogenase